MVMSEFIKNLDVTFEIVSPINDIEFTFYHTRSEVKAVQPKIIERQEQTAFSFDLPLFKTNQLLKLKKTKFCLN